MNIEHTETTSEEKTNVHGKIHGVVAAHIEPVTRFDGHDLTESTPETTFQVGVTLTLEQEVSFEISTHAGAGKLATGTDKEYGQAAFSSELNSRLSRAYREAPQAIENWAKANPGSYRLHMPSLATFIKHPGTVGYEHTCTTCAGACKVPCYSCGGRGKTDCHSCYGSGKVNCHSCHGTKKVKCSSCYGRGNWSEQVSQSTWNPGSNSYVTTYHTVYHNCSACYGSGQTTCYSCGYDGKISCSGCGGQGHINCLTCNTTGKVDCSACQASGIQHVSGTVKATVSHAEEQSIATQDEHLRKLIETRLPRESLPEFGALTNVDHHPEGDKLITRHEIKLDVREAHLEAGGESFTLHGFGPEDTIFSFENIAGHLLTDDLETLEAAVTEASRWRRHATNDLLDTTSAFLRSELNLLLAEKVADISATPEQAAQAVESHFSGLVDSGYIKRATNALRGALARLYGSELFEPAASLCGLTALAAGLQTGFGLHLGDPWLTGIISVGTAAVAWFVLEWITRRRIARHFEAEFGKRVVQQLNANGSVKRWRLGMAAALPIATTLAIIGTNALPPVRAHQQQLATQAASNQLLINWHSSAAQPDLRQRAYPDHTQLLHGAEAGDQRALIVLAWQFLLGTGETAKDVDEAKKWLDKATPETVKTPLWQTAKAVEIMNREAMPEELRQADQYLSEAAEQGFSEARYWLARLTLAEQSPMHDARKGVKALALAADQRHAHASLMLGQMYATGNGVPRNPNMARRYLSAAQSAGLTEANDSLQKLR